MGFAVLHPSYELGRCALHILRAPKRSHPSFVIQVLKNMPKIRRLLRLALFVGFIGVALGAATIGVLYWLIAPRLTDVQVLHGHQLPVPPTVYSPEGKTIRRSFVSEEVG